jgi:hypothetical protein
MVDLFKKDMEEKPKKPKANGPGSLTVKPPRPSEAKDPDTRFLENFKKAKGSDKEKIKAIIEYLQDIELLEPFLKLLSPKGKNNMQDQNNEGSGNGFVTDSCIDRLENKTLKNKARIKDSPIKEVDNDLQALFEKILEEIKAHRDYNPEKQLSVALSAIDKLDKKQFILSNLLEQLKKGEDYYKILERFNKLGLSDIKIPNKKDRNENIKGRGRAILDSIKSSGGIKKTLYQLVINFITSIPSFIKLKPRIVFTAGFIPSISFDIESTGHTMQEIFNLWTRDR